MKFYDEYLLRNKAFIRNSEDESWKQLFPNQEETHSIECFHEDFEERLYIGTTIEFDSNISEFNGLGKIEFEIKKKKIPSRIEIIDNVRNKKSKLF